MNRLLGFGRSGSHRRSSSDSDVGRGRRGSKKVSAVEEDLRRQILEMEKVTQALALEKEALVSVRAKEEEDKTKLLSEENQQEAERRKGMIMDKTEQGAERFDLNMGAMGLVDRLEAHPAGKLLKNVVISNEPPPDRELNIARLRKYKPQNDFAKLTLGDVPAFNLSEEFMELPITDAMTPQQFASLKQYILVSDVFIHYVPMDSFFSTSSPVIFQLNDFRKVDNNVMRDYPLTHSGGYNILMTLDYCVNKADLHHLSLSISTSLSSFRKGTSWAAVKVLLTISHMDFPVKANIQETMGVLHLADSDLQEFISDPRSSDGVITPQALALLRSHYKRGEIENINLPRDDKKEVNVAKTVIDKSQQDMDVRDLMAEMREKALMEQRKKNLKPALKRPKDASTSSPRINFANVQNDETGLSDLDEVQLGESRSEDGSEGTIELPRNESKGKGNMRSVNFG